MHRKIICIVVALTLAGLSLIGCSQAAPTQTAAPTKAAESPKAAEPTKASAQSTQPTAAPSKTVEFPAKGKAITLLVPHPAGGGSDIAARVLAPLLEKQLGTPVQVVNKPGASTQSGLTELAMAKPDGYTIGYPNLPLINTLYLNPDRKATFDRKSFEPIALHLADPAAIAVKADSPYETLTDLIDAAKANPKKIRLSDNGSLTPENLAVLELQEVTGATFANVHFDGVAPSRTALLGGHVDAALHGLSPLLPNAQSGELRILAVFDDQESEFAPGVKTAAAQGYEVYDVITRAWIAPAGTPKEIVEILSDAIKKAMDTEEHKKKMQEACQSPRYMNPTELGEYWDKLDVQMKPLLDMALQK